MRVKKHDVLWQRLLDEKVLEVPEAKVGDLGHLALGLQEDVAGLEVPVDNGGPHAVEMRHALARMEGLIWRLLEAGWI